MLRPRRQRLCIAALVGWLFAAVAARGSTSSSSKEPRRKPDFHADGDRLRPGGRIGKPWWAVLGGRAKEFVNVDVPAAFDVFSQKAKFQQIVVSESNWWHKTESIAHSIVEILRGFAEKIAVAARGAAAAIAAGTKELVQRASELPGAVQAWYDDVGVPWLRDSWAAASEAASVYYAAASDGYAAAREYSAALVCRAGENVRRAWSWLSAGGQNLAKWTTHHWGVVILPELRRRAHALQLFLRTASQEFLVKIHMAAPSGYKDDMMADFDLEDADGEMLWAGEEEAGMAAAAQGAEAGTAATTQQVCDAQPYLRHEAPETAATGSGGQCRRRNVPCCDCAGTWGAWQNRRRRLVKTPTLSIHSGSTSSSDGSAAATGSSPGAVRPPPHDIAELIFANVVLWFFMLLCASAIVLPDLAFLLMFLYGRWVCWRARFPRPGLAVAGNGAAGGWAAVQGSEGGVASNAPEDVHEPLQHPQAGAEALAEIEAEAEAESPDEPEFSGPESPGDSESGWVDVGVAADEQYAPNN